MPWRRVRVLADDQDPDVVERLLESAQHVLAGGQVRPAGRDLGSQEITCLGDLAGYRLERSRPAWIDYFFERASGHGKSL